MSSKLQTILDDLAGLTSHELIKVRDTAHNLAGRKLLGLPAEGASNQQASEEQTILDFFAHTPNPDYPSTPLQRRMQSSGG